MASTVSNGSAAASGMDMSTTSMMPVRQADDLIKIAHLNTTITALALILVGFVLLAAGACGFYGYLRMRKGHSKNSGRARKAPSENSSELNEYGMRAQHIELSGGSADPLKDQMSPRGMHGALGSPGLAI